jgi:hypothetical protein
VPAYDRAPLLDRLPKKPLAVPRLLARATSSAAGSYFQDPSPTATGYYAETGTGRDSGTLLLSPPLRFLKEEGSGPVIEDPSIALVPPMGRGTPTGSSPYRHVAVRVFFSYRLFCMFGSFGPGGRVAPDSEAAEWDLDST